jgi:protein-arginine kinase activator protein McsA
MKNANYNLVKMLLAKLDDVWRIEQHYAKDAVEHGCDRCEALLTEILKTDKEHIEALRQELAKHIKADEFA